MAKVKPPDKNKNSPVEEVTYDLRVNCENSDEKITNALQKVKTRPTNKK